MRVLGLETSCDETAAAVVETGEGLRGSVLSDVVHTQRDVHEKWGGVVPELASRDHLQRVLPVLDEALKKAGVDYPPVPPRYRSTYFSHAFAGGYSAGYYSYLWSEVLDADSVEWMKQHGGLKRENGDHFRATLLSRGGSDDAMKLFRNFTGSDPDVTPLLKRRGLTKTAPAEAPAPSVPPK